MTFIPRWWNELPAQPGAPANLKVFGERDGARALVFDALRDATRDHFVQAEILAALDFPTAAHLVRTRLPKAKKIRSGDFGEILGTEYVNQCTDYRVPLKRLRYKDAGELSMRGDDFVGVRVNNGRVQMLKGEAKSRARIAGGVVAEACEALCKGRSAPSQDTLAFIFVRLCEQGRLDEADLIKACMSDTVGDADVAHLIFTFSGNDPVAALAPYATGPVTRYLAGFVVSDHQALIRSVFEAIHANP